MEREGSSPFDERENGEELQPDLPEEMDPGWCQFGAGASWQPADSDVFGFGESVREQKSDEESEVSNDSEYWDWGDDQYWYEEEEDLDKYWEENEKYMYPHTVNHPCRLEIEDIFLREERKRAGHYVTPFRKKATMVFDQTEYEVSDEPSDFRMLKTVSEIYESRVDIVRHLPSHKLLAIKKVKRNYVDRCLEIDMDKLEEMIKSIDHPNILRFYGVIYRERDLWVFTEKMDISLQTLQEKFYKGADVDDFMPEEFIWNIASCVMKAISHLHHVVKVSHGDIRTTKVLLDANGNVKLSSFSGTPINPMRKILFKELHKAMHLAPESVTKAISPYCDERSDIWCLGFILCQLVINRNPFWFEYTVTRMRRVQKKYLSSWMRKLKHFRLSSDFFALISRCMVTEIEGRATVEELMKLEKIENPPQFNMAFFVETYCWEAGDVQPFEAAAANNNGQLEGMVWHEVMNVFMEDVRDRSKGKSKGRTCS